VPRSAPLLLTVAIALCLVVWSPPARAQEARSGPAYQLKLELDLPIVLIGGATASSFFILPEAPGVACAPDCDRSKINRFDRPAAGLYDSSWSTVGNVATATTMAMPIVFILADQGFVDGLNDDLVVAEAALLSSALQVTMSFAVSRPRPRVYGSEASLESRSNANAARSFFSGHIANTMATSVAALRTYQRLRRPVVAWILFGVGAAGSTLVGISRVAAGSHFPSDVIAGAAVGAGMGLALPAVHDSKTRFTPYASHDTAGLLVRGAWD
jgi:membrane-associated phospholipid phosphatase